MAVREPGHELEDAARAAGRAVVAGCDEAGRGPLAGPVAAAAVILPVGLRIPGLNDSKKLKHEQRLRLYHAVRAQAIAVGLGLASPAEIDALNILQASLLAMRRALADLGCPVDHVLIDGNQRVPKLTCAQETVVKGDSRSASIAAASIIAKVTRDAVLERLDRLFPGYNLAGNKGYPSPDHLAALKELGPAVIHRTSYRPVRELLDEPPPLPPSKSRGGVVQLSLFGDDDLAG